MALRLKVYRPKAITGFFQHKRFKSVWEEEVINCREIPGLLGRDFIDPTHMLGNEYRDLLWTALDLKSTLKNRKCLALDLLAGKSVMLLLARPCIKSQMSIPNAAAMLGATANTFIDKDWEAAVSVPDTGRFLATQSDIIFCLGDHQEATCHLADGSRKPVISIFSNKYAPLKGLTDMMTIYEYYGKLKKLTMGYLGPAGLLFNTYLAMLPVLGMDMQFTNDSSPGGQNRPDLETCIRLSQKNNTGIHEYSTAKQAIYRADIIATEYHKMEKLHIAMEDLEEAAIDWVFLHSLPRSGLEVCDEVFFSKRSLVFEAASNTVWVAMALMLRCLRDYDPKMKKPDFDGDNQSI